MLFFFLTVWSYKCMYQLKKQNKFYFGTESTNFIDYRRSFSPNGLKLSLKTFTLSSSSSKIYFVFKIIRGVELLSWQCVHTEIQHTIKESKRSVSGYHKKGANVIPFSFGMVSSARNWRFSITDLVYMFGKKNSTNITFLSSWNKHLDAMIYKENTYSKPSKAKNP